MPEPNKIKIVASANGLKAVRRAYELVASGVDTLDAVVAGITLVEDDPGDLTVGYGGLPNEEGVVELDAAVMHGPTHRAGAVGALRNIRNPGRVAQLVLEQSDHALLVGEGALAFARAHGFPEENLLTETARKIWLYWKQSLSDKDDWLPPPPEKLDPDVAHFFHLDGGRSSATSDKDPYGWPKPTTPWTKFDRPTGTVHLSALDARGDISCATSTSGLAFKLPGRLGDSPMIGAGLYVDNAIGSCGCTGRGEASMQSVCSFAAVELMRHGREPREAGVEVLQRVADHTHEPHLLDEHGRPAFNVKLYLLHKDGAHAGVALWGPAEIAVADAHGARLESCAALFENK